MDLYLPWIACYGIVALVAVTMTRREQRHHGQISPLNTCLGVSLSLMWPMAVVLMLAAMLWRAVQDTATA